MTAIEWTDATWNPIVGCSIATPGCTNCYAMDFAGKRLDRDGGPAHYRGTTKVVNGKRVWTGKLALAPEHVLLAPLKRRKPTMWFVNSMGDLFHEDVPDEWIDRVFAVMALCPQHTFQVLTKRANRMKDYLSLDTRARAGIVHASQDLKVEARPKPFPRLPLPNVWLGVSAERQQEADARIPDLLATPAAIRFVSAEPLLGPVDFERILWEREYYQSGAHHYIDVLRGGFWSPTGPGYRASQDGEPKNHFTNHSDIKDQLLNWIIVGGESGHDARPMVLGWAKDIVRQCSAAEVAVFVKQMGSKPTNREGERCPHIRHRKGADMAEWPPELRVREWPTTTHDLRLTTPAAEVPSA